MKRELIIKGSISKDLVQKGVKTDAMPLIQMLFDILS